MAFPVKRTTILLAALMFPLMSAGQAAPLAAAQTAARPIIDGDDLFQHPFVDIDEWRSTPGRHHYIHGGFKGTDTLFSFYFPEKKRYHGRFFQHITPVPESENLAQKHTSGEEDKIGFAFASGAYFVETNGGGANNIGAGDSTITAYRANAAAAAYSRVVAAKLYGAHRPYGYAYGGSGGGFRTIGSIERTSGVWDGVVPYVIGSTMALPNVFSVRIHAMRILWDKFPQIVDAVDAGGSGDPYAGLNEEESAALREVTKMGFPLQSWFGYKTMGVHGFAAVYPIMKAIDPTYFTDFWTVPGYLGANPPTSLLQARVQHNATVAKVVTAREAGNAGIVLRQANGSVDNSFLSLGGKDQTIVGFHLSAPPPQIRFLGGDLIIRSGTAAGKSLQVREIAGDIIVLGANDASLVAQIRPGDAVTLDTSDFLAAQTYHRHQVPGPDFAVWDQFRNTDGTPRYPQRRMLIGPMIVQSTAGSLETGRINGKMIVISSSWDREAYPWQADWYRRRVEQQLGDRFNDSFRLWYTDHAMHGDEALQEDPTRTVSYIGVLQQALRDLSLWVEKGVPPSESTNYKVVDGQIVVPATASERKGIQPVVSLTANGKTRVEVPANTPILFEAIADVPPGKGKIVEARLDMDGIGNYPIAARLTKAANGVTSVSTRYSFTRPGVYFPTVRVVSQRDGDARTPYTRLQNIARVRVIIR